MFDNIFQFNGIDNPIPKEGLNYMSHTERKPATIGNNVRLTNYY